MAIIAMKLTSSHDKNASILEQMQPSDYPHGPLKSIQPFPNFHTVLTNYVCSIIPFLWLPVGKNIGAF